MLEYVKCNLCGSENKEVIILGEGISIVCCKDCGLVFKDPQPSEEEIVSHVASDGVVKEHFEPVWRDSKNGLFRKNLQRLEKLNLRRGSLLDIGCGYGIFLKAAQDKGWKVTGVEISQSASKYARDVLGLDIFPGPLQRAHFPNDSFDAVTLWEVLPVLHDPIGQLREVNRILKNEGIIALRLYNVGFHIFLQKLFKSLGNLDVKLGLSPTIFHLYNFSPKTIKAMLEKAGFGDVGILVSELTSGDPYSTGGRIRPCGVAVTKYILFIVSKIIFILTAGAIVVSPSLLVFARKKA